MAKFCATVRMTALDGVDPVTVRRAVVERLREAGLDHYQVLRIDREGAAIRPVRRAPHHSRPQRGSDIRGMLLVAAAAWTMWFFWQLAAG